jgi:hypothetical protein
MSDLLSLYDFMHFVIPVPTSVSAFREILIDFKPGGRVGYEGHSFNSN